MSKLGFKGYESNTHRQSTRTNPDAIVADHLTQALLDREIPMTDRDRSMAAMLELGAIGTWVSPRPDRIGCSVTIPKNPIALTMRPEIARKSGIKLRGEPFRHAVSSMFGCVAKLFKSVLSALLGNLRSHIFFVT